MSLLLNGVCVVMSRWSSSAGIVEMIWFACSCLLLMRVIVNVLFCFCIRVMWVLKWISVPAVGQHFTNVWANPPVPVFRRALNFGGPGGFLRDLGRRSD